MSQMLIMADDVICPEFVRACLGVFFFVRTRSGFRCCVMNIGVWACVLHVDHVRACWLGHGASSVSIS